MQCIHGETPHITHWRFFVFMEGAKREGIPHQLDGLAAKETFFVLLPSITL